MLVRIVLDTCAIRNILHNDSSQLDFEAIKSSNEQLRFSVAGGAGVELLEQLVSGQIKWSDWAENIKKITKILDGRWPLLPTGRQLTALAGTQTDITIDIENERRYLNACWNLQVRSKSTSDLQKGGYYEKSNGERIILKLTLDNLSNVLDKERQSWIDYIQNIQELVQDRGITTTDQKSILNILKSTSGNYPGDPPDYGDRLDSVMHMISNLVSQSLKESDPYNPEKGRRRGDTFDISLLYYVPLPSVVCTADKKFVNRLRNSNPLHSKQVVSIDELNQHIIHNSVGNLVSSFRTEEEQFKSWQKAAYFNWIERKMPLDDPDTDWHASEPIA